MGDVNMTKKHVSHKELLYQRILEKIIRLGFPQEIFLTEGALAEELNASRVSIRETLITLCNHQILKNIPRIGYQIVQLTTHDISDAIRTRGILEIGAARDYLPRVTDTQIEALLARVEPSFKVAAAKDSTVEEWWEGNILFHISIASLAGNELLAEMLKKTLDILWRANIQFFWNKEPDKYLKFNRGSHEAILETIETRNLKNLIKNLAQDIESLKANFQVL